MDNSKQIVFFDGVCNLCNSSVDFIIRHNSKRSLFIASLQRQTAQKLLPEDKTKQLGSLIFYNGAHMYECSTGALKITAELDFPYKILVQVSGSTKIKIYTNMSNNPLKMCDVFYDMSWHTDSNTNNRNRHKTKSLCSFLAMH